MDWSSLTAKEKRRRVRKQVKCTDRWGKGEEGHCQLCKPFLNGNHCLRKTWLEFTTPKIPSVFAKMPYVSQKCCVIIDWIIKFMYENIINLWDNFVNRFVSTFIVASFIVSFLRICPLGYFMVSLHPRFLLVRISLYR